MRLFGNLIFAIIAQILCRKIILISYDIIVVTFILAVHNIFCNHANFFMWLLMLILYFKWLICYIMTKPMRQIVVSCDSSFQRLLLKIHPVTGIVEGGGIVPKMKGKKSHFSINHRYHFFNVANCNCKLISVNCS